MTDTITQLARIGEQIATQDNAGTAEVMWTIQERIEIAGVDEDYHDTHVVWVRDGEQCDEHKSAAMERRWQNGREDFIPDDYTRVLCTYRWVTRQAFFTKTAAEQYRDTQARRHGGPLRIYADWGGRNSEWKLMRRLLVALLKEQSGE